MYHQSSILILASTSPRRRELLTELGVQFEIIPANIDETVQAGETPRQLAARLSLAKATVIAEQHPERFVLGADTDVELDGRILGKPKDHADAQAIIASIAGRTHTVWGGCALVCKARGIADVIVSQTDVTMLPISSETIAEYVKTGEPMDKAGAYAVQGIGSQFIDRINGSYPNVVGLDTPRVMELLKKHQILCSPHQ